MAHYTTVEKEDHNPGYAVTQRWTLARPRTATNTATAACSVLGSASGTAYKGKGTPFPFSTCYRNLHHSLGRLAQHTVLPTETDRSQTPPPPTTKPHPYSPQSAAAEHK